MILNLQEGFNLWAVLAAGTASLFLGFIWYGPLFGKPWARYTGWTEEKVKTVSGRSMGLTYGLAFLAALAQALALTVLSRSLGASEALDGLLLGLLAGLGFTAMAFATTLLFEHKPVGLWLIISGYEVVYLAAAGVIITVWR